MTIAQIRRELLKRIDGLFASDADRTLLAILEADSYAEDPGAAISAQYTQGRVHAEQRVRDLIQAEWSKTE